MKILKGDTVKIIVGKDRSKSGLVMRVFPDGKLLTVKGIHLLKKHVKPSRKNPSGGIIEINKKIDISDVMLICPNCGRTAKVGYRIDKEGKTRICRKCQKSVQVSKET